MDDRKKPGIGFWATVVVVTLLVLYPLSFGPACWFTSRFDYGRKQMPFVYRPVTWVMEKGSSRVQDAVYSYYSLFAKSGWHWVRHEFKDSEGEHLEWRFQSVLIGNTGRSAAVGSLVRSIP